MMIGFGTAQAQFPAPYCAPPDFTNNVEPITLVNFAGINNVTSATLNGTPDIENFTAMTANVVAGLTYTITLKGNTDGAPYTNRFAVFADWNHDNDFADTGETYEILQTIQGSTGNDAIQAVQDLMIPGDALAGPTRLRVKKIFDVVGYLDPCVSAGFGQFEDYTVTVTIPACPAPGSGVADVTSGSSADLSWNSTGTDFEIVVQLASEGVPADANGTGVDVEGTTYAASDLIGDSNYEFYVRNECTDGTDFSTWAGPFAFTTTQAPACVSNPTPANGATGVQYGPIILNWDVAATGDAATSYDLYVGETADDLGYFATYDTNSSGADISVTAFEATVYWQIIPVNAGGEGTGCAVWSFTTESEPAAPGNDECGTATALIPGGNYDLAVVDGVNTSATDSGQDPSESDDCVGYVGGDIWYSVVVPASGNLTIQTGNQPSGAGGIDTVIIVYSGTCGALVEEDCDDDGFGASGFSLLELTGQAPGSTLLVRVYEYNDDTQGHFGIAAFDDSLLGVGSFNSNNFKYYPNPVTNVLNLSYTDNISNVSVYNLLGQEVLAKSINATEGQIDMSPLARGTYLVKVASNNEVKTVKVIRE